MRFVLIVCLGCRNVAAPACGPDGHPPNPTVENGTLFRDSPQACPKTEPAGACSTGDMCTYAATTRGPCEFDLCACQNGAWSCSVAME